MDLSVAILWALALGFVAVAAVRGGERLALGFKASGGLVSMMVVRLPLGLALAGFLGELVPSQVVAAWMGAEAGWQGIVVASLVGGFTPSGPFVSFPIALALYKAGAGLPQVVAFVTAWSVFAFNRVVVWEWPLLGARFATIRLAVSLPIPPLVGLIAGAMLGGP